MAGAVSALFLLDIKGRVLVWQDYRGDVSAPDVSPPPATPAPPPKLGGVVVIVGGRLSWDALFDDGVPQQGERGAVLPDHDHALQDRVMDVLPQAGQEVIAPPESGITGQNPSERQLWFASKQSLSYLDGSLPSDYGFDPLGLSDPEGPGGFIEPRWLAYGEVINGRYAMLGAVAPEIFGKLGLIPQETALPWFKTGVILPAGTYNYWADPYTLFVLEMALMGFAEHRRFQDWANPGSMGKQYFLGLEKGLGGSGDPAYPGGPFFNPLGLGKDEKSLKDLKLKEVKNGGRTEVGAALGPGEGGCRGGGRAEVGAALGSGGGGGVRQVFFFVKIVFVNGW
ncbi:hypothetical protein Taro_017722 [Colocasia esculenta]|uniref:Chlorophyll a-b binding protein, chloroplastic n=1 Tax=Colocasia esculenta TaxID=4460 RepID=A0A843US34_COLES|nr:hypothetical protein [Colocasia esculenta]